MFVNRHTLLKPTDSLRCDATASQPVGPILPSVHAGAAPPYPKSDSSPKPRYATATLQLPVMIHICEKQQAA